MGLSFSPADAVLLILTTSPWIAIWWILRNRINPDDLRSFEDRQMDSVEKIQTRQIEIINRLAHLEGRLGGYSKHIEETEEHD